MWQALAAGGIDVDIRHGDDDDPLLGVGRGSQGDRSVDLVVGRSSWQRDIMARARPTQVFSLDLRHCDGRRRDPFASAASTRLADAQLRTCSRDRLIR